MSHFYLWIIAMLDLQTYVMSKNSCGEEHLIGAVGGAIALHFRNTEVEEIRWTFEKKKNAIARTIQGGPPEILDNQYKGRLSTTSDHSLTITDLREEDQGTYRAAIPNSRQRRICEYQLMVFSKLTAEDIVISSSVTDYRTCELSLTCSVNPIKETNVTITWRSINSNDIALTQNVVFVPPSNSNFFYICTAENPVSNVSKTVHPWEYCERDVMSEAPSVKEDVLGAVGGAVTLHLCYIGAKSIIWNFVKRGISIARTKPQESPEIDDSNYEGRLSSTPDGSLIITELRLEDQGAYRAQFRTDKGTKICDYHLTVFSNLMAENVTINSNVTDNKTCEVSLTCLVDSVNGRNVTIIWKSLNSSNVNQTQNVVFVPPSNINFTYICTAKNPVSNVSKNVVPWLSCNNGVDRENTPKEDYSMVNLIRLVISGCVLLISCCIFIHHMKTEVITQPPETSDI